jgi:hypothetical protein
MDRIIYTIGAILILTIAIKCGDNYNNIAFKDHNAKNEYVYGKEGEPARQTKVKYPKDSVAEARAAKIREKLYGKDTVNTKGN